LLIVCLYFLIFFKVKAKKAPKKKIKKEGLTPPYGKNNK
jgi:hypothetical protein